MRIGIVGCSIDGGYLGYKLGKMGHDVTIFEQKQAIGGKACSGLVSERIWNFFPRNESLVENRITHVEMHFPRRDIELRFKPDMYALDRNELDRYAAKLALESGAKIELGARLARIIQIGGSKPHLVVEKGGQTIVKEVDRVVGCDGSLSKVREHFTEERPRLRLGIHCFAARKDYSPTVEVWPTKSGFFWKIPRGERVEYGIMEDTKAAGKEFKKFLRKQKVKKPQLHSALIPEGPVTLNTEYAILCGDAAGLTKPWSGGGIIWGLNAAQMFIENGLDARKYGGAVRSFYAPKIFFSKITTMAVNLVGRNTPNLLPNNVKFDGDWSIF